MSTTEENLDVRWRQRLIRYRKAYEILERIAATEDPNEAEQMGLIQAFEVAFEQGWCMLNDYLRYQGEVNVNGPRESIQRAFVRSLISNGELWMAMHRDRNLTSHTYDSELAEEMAERIRWTYLEAFEELLLDFEAR